MKHLFEGFALERPPAGGVRIGLSMPVGVMVAGALAGAIILPAGLILAMPHLKLPVSPWLIIAIIVAAEFSFAGVMLFLGQRSRSVITAHRGTGRLVMETGAERTELAMADIVSAGMVAQPTGRSPPAQTLRFLLRDNRQVDLGNRHPYRHVDVARAVEALNAEMGARNRMVG